MMRPRIVTVMVIIIKKITIINNNNDSYNMSIMIKKIVK
jgi:hypothetical protein